MASRRIAVTPRGWLLAITLVGALGALIAVPFDRDWSQWFRQLDLPGDLNKALNLSEVFGHSAGVASILASVWLVAQPRRRAVWGAILITLTSGAAANLSKALVVRIRPHSEGSVEVVNQHLSPLASEVGRAAAALGPGPQLSAATGLERVAPSFWDSRQRSFPSGHAATACGLAIGLSLVFPRGAGLFAAFALLAGLQRIFSGAHYPSDVLAGMALASILAWGLLTWTPVRSMFQPDSA